MNLEEARKVYQELKQDGSPLSLKAAEVIAWCAKRKAPKKKAAPNPKKSKPASLEELKLYVVSLGLPLSDAEYLWDHWNENGFKNNGRAIRDWKLTIQKWQRIGVLPKTGTGKSKQERNHSNGF
jgi:hypothetical protein